MDLNFSQKCHMLLLVKIVSFGDNGQNWVILGAKMTSYVKICGKSSNNFSLRVSKNYFSHVFGQKFGQICR